MMSANLDGNLDGAESDRLQEHLATCEACQAEWQRLQAVDRLLASASMVQAPVRVRVQVMTRLSRRDQARRAFIGGTALALGTVALALIILAPVTLGLLNSFGIAPALASGGPATLAHLLSIWSAMGRTGLILAGQFAVPLILIGLCGLFAALTLNSICIKAMRRLRASR
jgi:anti-sigma factor RsiW